MQLISVKSSAVTHVGHDGHALHVVYKGGRHYVHAGVSESKYNALLASDSIGKYINDHIENEHPGVAK